MQTCDAQTVNLFGAKYHGDDRKPRFDEQAFSKQTVSQTVEQVAFSWNDLGLCVS